MIKRFFLPFLLIVFGMALMVSAQTDVSLKTRITLHKNIFEEINQPRKSEFKFDEKILVALELTNESSEETGIIVGQQWRYLRPKLVREDGKVVPYKAEIQQLLKEGNPFYSPVVHLTLKPNVPAVTDYIDLDYWYDKPEAGRYTISVERIWVKQTFASNDVDFSIVS